MANVGPNTWYCWGNPGIDVFPLGIVEQASGATLALTPVTVPVGATIIVDVTEGSAASIGTIADGVNGSYGAAVASSTMASAAGFVGCFAFSNSAAVTAGTITYTKVTSGNKASMKAHYVLGLKTSSANDAPFTATANGTGTAVTVTSNTPAGQHEYVHGVVGYSNAASSKTATMSGAWNYDQLAVNSQSSAQMNAGWVVNGGTLAMTYPATLNSSSNWAALIVAFKVTAKPTVGWYNVAPWTASDATIVAGSRRRQNAPPIFGVERIYAALNSGTTGGTEPAFPTAKGGTVADNGITWIEITGQPGVNGDTANSPTWTQNKNLAVTRGLIIYDSVSASLQIVSTAGTTGNGSLPGFSATAGVTTSDNSVTWTSLGLASGFAAWACPFATLQGGTGNQGSTSGNLVGFAGVSPGQQMFVSSTHLEVCGPTSSLPGGTNFPVPAVNVSTPTTMPNLDIWSVDPNGAFPPDGTAYLPGATMHNLPLGTGQMGNIWGAIALHGFNIDCGYVSLGGSIGGDSLFEDMVIKFTWLIQVGNNQMARADLFNITLQGNSTGAFFAAAAGSTMRKVTFLSGTYNPLYVIDNNNAGGNCGARFLDCDLHLLTPTTLFDQTAQQYGAAPYVLKRCYLPTNVPIGQPTLNASPSGAEEAIFILNSSSGASQFNREKWSCLGVQTTSTTIVRTGSSALGEGGTQVAWKIATTTLLSWSMPFLAIPFATWNTQVGVTYTCTVYGLANAAALPNNDAIWFDLSFFGSATSVLGSEATTTKANALTAGSPLSADASSVWNSAASARVNGQSYAVGDAIAVSSNTRVFFCTQAGAAAGSLPAGYASAVDGGSVTDSGAIFRAGVRFTMSVTLSAPAVQLVGSIWTQIRAAKASSSYWLDPVLYLT